MVETIHSTKNRGTETVKAELGPQEQRRLANHFRALQELHRSSKDISYQSNDFRCSPAALPATTKSSRIRRWNEDTPSSTTTDEAWLEPSFLASVSELAEYNVSKMAM